MGGGQAVSPRHRRQGGGGELVPRTTGIRSSSGTLTCRVGMDRRQRPYSSCTFYGPNQVKWYKIGQLKQQRFEFDLTFMTRALVCTVTDHALFEHIHPVLRPQLEEGWGRLSKILDYTTSILPSHAYIHSTRDMSTTNPLIPIVRFLGLNGGKFPSAASLRRGLHWLYVSQIHQRYTGQTDGRLEHDVTIVNREGSPWQSLLNQIVDQRGRVEVLPDDFEGRGAGHPPL